MQSLVIDGWTVESTVAIVNHERNEMKLVDKYFLLRRLILVVIISRRRAAPFRQKEVLNWPKHP